MHCDRKILGQERLTEQENAPLKGAEHLEEGLCDSCARYQLGKDSDRLSCRPGVDGLYLRGHKPAKRTPSCAWKALIA